MSPEAVNREIVPTLLKRMEPYMKGEKEPRLKNWYVLLWPSGGTIGARVIDDKRIGDLERVVRDEVVAGLPDTRVFVNEGELFGGIGGSARSVAIHLQSTDTDALNATAEEGRKLLERTFPGANVQSFPNADVQALELRAEPNDRRIAEVGWDRASLGTVVRALGDGAWLGEYFDGQTRLPVMLRTNLGETPEALAQGAVDDAVRRNRVARRARESADDAGAGADPSYRSSPHGDTDDRSAADAVPGGHAGEDPE
jgi:hypothetical protein